MLRPTEAPEASSLAHYDPLRQSAVRYIAFTSDVGEAFKPFISRRLYMASYGIVAAYGLIDTADKGLTAYRRTAKAPAAPSSPLACAAPAGLGGSALPGTPLAALHCAAASSASEPPPTALPVVAAVGETALWHAAASLAIPCLLINRTVWAVGHLLSRPSLAARLPGRLRQLVPSLAGLALLPSVVPHVDEGVTEWMQKHLRPHLPAASENHA